MANNNKKNQQQPAQSTKSTAPKIDNNDYLGRLGTEGSDTIAGRSINLDANKIDYGQGKFITQAEYNNKVEQEKGRERYHKLEKQIAKADRAAIDAGTEKIKVGTALHQFVESAAGYVNARESTSHTIDTTLLNREIRANDLQTKTYEVQGSATKKNNALNKLQGMGVTDSLEKIYNDGDAKEVNTKEKAKA